MIDCPSSNLYPPTMPLFDEETLFEDLPLRVYRNLVKELDKNSAWKLVARYLAENVASFSMSRVDSFEELKPGTGSARQSPAELMLYDLLDANGSITVGFFCDILKYCNLLDALSILRGSDPLAIVEQPYPLSPNGRATEVSIGDTFSITCKVTGLPQPRYQWFRGNIELPNQTANCLSLLITSPDQEGDYNCRVSQYNDVEELLDEKYSDFTSLTIKSTCLGNTEQPASVEVKSTESKDDWNGDEETCNTSWIEQSQRTDNGEYSCYVSKNMNKVYSADKRAVTMEQKAKTKVALLIANGNYQNGGKLNTAENDAAVIATLLKKIGFHVICLQNLTLKEMRNVVQIFCAALIPGSYGFFYFVGHGFKMDGFHMMPANVRKKFLPKDAYSQDELLFHALEKKPALLVVILDMVLTVPPKELIPGIYNKIPKSCESKCKGTLILAYSTCSYADAYELKDARNGIYVSHLSKHITGSKPVCELFMGVAQSVSESTIGQATGRKPMLLMVPVGPQRYLTDAVTCESLQEWDVSFHKSPEGRAELYPMYTTCAIYNPQRITTWEQGSLVIKIGKNGRVHESIRFFYMKYVPELVNALWQ